MKPVLVFKTSVATADEEAFLKPLLDNLFHDGQCWNFDLEDWENILRVENSPNAATVIINTLNQVGFQCEELTD